jgi:hypothetical protein
LLDGDDGPKSFAKPGVSPDSPANCWVVARTSANKSANAAPEPFPLTTLEPDASWDGLPNTSVELNCPVNITLSLLRINRPDNWSIGVSYPVLEMNVSSHERKMRLPLLVSFLVAPHVFRARVDRPIEVQTMLFRVCKEHPAGRLGSAICLRGHSTWMCIEPDCVDQNTSCLIPECGCLVAVLRSAEEPSPLSTP